MRLIIVLYSAVKAHRLNSCLDEVKTIDDLLICTLPCTTQNLQNQYLCRLWPCSWYNIVLASMLSSRETIDIKQVVNLIIISSSRMTTNHTYATGRYSFVISQIWGLNETLYSIIPHPPTTALFKAEESKCTSLYSKLAVNLTRTHRNCMHRFWSQR